MGIVALVALAPWLLVFILSREAPRLAAPAATAGAPTPAGSATIVKCRPGPWGELSYNRIVIEPPETLVDRGKVTSRPTAWNFKGYTPEALLALWNSAGLDEAQRRFISDPSHWELSAGGIVVRPTLDFVLGLAAPARTKIYSALAAFDENPDQKEPYRFRADAAAEWFANSGLRPETVALLERVLYRRGSSLLISDTNLLLDKVPTLQERTRLIKTLARKSTLLVKLRVRPDTDVEALDNYWDRGRRSKDLKPLLQSLTREADGMTIDIIHLLPRLPRALLYTYPALTDAGIGSFLDCHWTVLNFFNAVPDERFQRRDAVMSNFLGEYFAVTGPRTFGDVLLFARPDGSVVHTCVYIADDIVFTKNGMSASAPWILMTLPDVVAFYPNEDAIDIQVYRAKNPGMPVAGTP